MTTNPVARMAALSMLLAAVAAGPSAAQGPGAYPNRPIRLIVPFPTGGGADLTARTVAPTMSELLRQAIVVENRPGANGLIGSEQVARSAPDGHTLLLVERGAMGINPSLYRKLPYDPLNDFAYIGVATTAPYVLVVSPSLPARTLTDLIALSKRKPGWIQYGSFGVGSMAQLNLEAFNQRHGTDFGHVPYKGAAAAVTAVVSGEVGVAIASAPSVLGFIGDGRLRALGVGSERRLELLPQVPTLTEAGLGTDTLIPTYFALGAPAGTPHEVVMALNAAMKQALDQAQVAALLRSRGLVPSASSPEILRQTVMEDIARFRALALSIGLKPE